MTGSRVSLEFVLDGRVLFSSSGKWLHPLFELEQFLTGRGIDASGGEIRDKVVGRGSAFLIVRLGVRRVHAGLLSRLGKDVLDRAGAVTTWEQLVDEIQCQTESMLKDQTDWEAAYRLLAERAGKARRPTGARRPEGA
jgi:zinc transport system ATP-binding protein